MSLILLKVNVARVKLQSRKTVDSSESLPLSNLNEPPVLTTSDWAKGSHTLQWRTSMLTRINLDF